MSRRGLTNAAAGLLKTLAVLLGGTGMVLGFVVDSFNPGFNLASLALGLLILAAIGLWSVADWIEP